MKGKALKASAVTRHISRPLAPSLRLSYHRFQGIPLKRLSKAHLQPVAQFNRILPTRKSFSMLSIVNIVPANELAPVQRRTRVPPTKAMKTKKTMTQLKKDKNSFESPTFHPSLPISETPHTSFTSRVISDYITDLTS